MNIKNATTTPDPEMNAPFGWKDQAGATPNEPAAGHDDHTEGETQEYLVFRCARDGSRNKEEEPVFRVRAHNSDEACRLAAQQIPISPHEQFLATSG